MKFGGSRPPQHAGLHQDEEEDTVDLGGCSSRHGVVGDGDARRRSAGLGLGIGMNLEKKEGAGLQAAG